MKCILYTSVLAGGGAERVLCQLANRLAEEHQVTIVAAYPSDNEYELAQKVRKVYLDSAVETKNPLKQIIGLRRLVRIKKPDICISFLPQPNFKLLLATIGIRTKVIVSVRNDPAREYANKVDKILVKLLYPLASGVVFQTSDAQKWFPEKIVRKSRVIMNQVNPVFFQTERKAEEYYVATGRLNNQKNYPMMIRAFVRFLEKYPDEKLYIYGSGPLEKELQALIGEYGVEKNICLKGQSNDIQHVLARAKAFVMSSDFEGMPNGLLEAMAMGLPCISTDCPCGGPREIIQNNVDGILIGVNDEEEMYRALCRIQRDDGYRHSITQKAKENAKRFHPDVVFRDWQSYISTIVSYQ